MIGPSTFDVVREVPEATLPELFEAQAARAPESTASNLEEGVPPWTSRARPGMRPN